MQAAGLPVNYAFKSGECIIITDAWKRRMRVFSRKIRYLTYSKFRENMQLRFKTAESTGKSAAGKISDFTPTFFTVLR